MGMRWGEVHFGDLGKVGEGCLFEDEGSHFESGVGGYERNKRVENFEDVSRMFGKGYKHKRDCI